MSDPRRGVAAYYVRVSSKDQRFAAQLPDMERAARAEAVPVVWFEDKASGRSMERPGWSRLWTDVVARRVSRLVVWRLDRLGRTVPGVTALFPDLARYGVALVSLREGFDLSTASGKLVASVLASFAEYELEVRGDRVREGMSAARARGVRLGRPPGTLGPSKVSPGRRDLIARLRAEGQPVAQIAAVLGLHRDTVYAALKVPR